MSNLKLSDEKMAALLNMAGKKLGQDPAQLRDQLESGNLGNLLKNMDPKSADKVNAVLKDPKALEALMANDQVKNLLSSLMGGNAAK